MCRLRQFRYLACGHSPALKHATDCANRPNCITEIIPQDVDRFCNACLLSADLERRREDHNYIINDNEREAAKTIFAEMAAPPGQQYGQRYLDSEPDFLHYYYYYDAEDVHQFYQRVGPADGLLLKRIEYVMNALIWEMLLDANISDPTENQIRLYLQIREAALVHPIHEDEDRRAGRERPDHHQEIIRRLGQILTELPLPEAATECPICLEDYGHGDALELPIELPCGHLYGRACLEAWVRAFVPGSGEFVVCHLCRAGFGILTGLETAAGIGVPEGEEIPWWITDLRSIWPEANGVAE